MAAHRTTVFVVGSTEEGGRGETWIVDWRKTQMEALALLDLLNKVVGRLQISANDPDCGDMEWAERVRNVCSPRDPTSALACLWAKLRMVDPQIKVRRNGVSYSIQRCRRPDEDNITALAMQASVEVIDGD